MAHVETCSVGKRPKVQISGRLMLTSELVVDIFTTTLLWERSGAVMLADLDCVI